MLRILFLSASVAQLVEQLTLNQLVHGSSRAARRLIMALFILRGSSGRYYIGSTNDLERCVSNNIKSGHTHTTQRPLGVP